MLFRSLKGGELYKTRGEGSYDREDFHEHPEKYECRFLPFAAQTDILMNGVYWEKNIPRLFEKTDINKQQFIIRTIADITDDQEGSVPINLGDQSIEDPVYGVDIESLKKTAPYIDTSIDLMAVGNLPNELPRDASRYFGEQLLKHVLEDLLGKGSAIIERATITKNGGLTTEYAYLNDYATGS